MENHQGFDPLQPSDSDTSGPHCPGASSQIAFQLSERDSQSLAKPLLPPSQRIKALKTPSDPGVFPENTARPLGQSGPTALSSPRHSLRHNTHQPEDSLYPATLSAP
ncbi:unnamed protein product [Boreogadus saida]